MLLQVVLPLRILLDVRVVIDDEFGLDAMAVRICEGPRIKVPGIRVQMFRMLYAGLVKEHGEVA